MRAASSLFCLPLVATLLGALAACGPSSSDDGGGDDDDDRPGTCQPGAGVCDGNVHYECAADGTRASTR